MKTKKKTALPRYDAIRAGSFWSQRLKSTDPLSAVLTYNAPTELNRAYDEWERKSLLDHLPSKMKGKRVLDLGSGIGRLSIPLAKLGAEVIAVDPSDGMRRHLAKEAKKAGVDSRVTTVSASADQIPFGDKLFDIAICFGVLEHLPEHARKTCLQELIRVVNRRGKIFAVVNNFDNALLRETYDLKAQRKDGYFVSLVGLEWIQRQCRRFDAIATVRTANPFYAMAHYYLHPNVKKTGMTKREFAELCRQLPQLDAVNGLSEPFCKRMASHYLVEIVRK
ncbi:MAG: methyltransferase domain-containing protein [candidate division Zixibacteria bacterium]|nr:methyltransferase domain-containing protein [candidate division Zixibacteria bacterium]